MTWRGSIHESLNAGEAKPAAVTCEVRIDLSTLRGPVRSEWDQIKQHDVLFLMAAEGPADGSQSMRAGAGGGDSGGGGRGYKAELNPAERFGLKYVRGAEVVEAGAYTRPLLSST